MKHYLQYDKWIKQNLELYQYEIFFFYFNGPDDIYNKITLKYGNNLLVDRVANLKEIQLFPFIEIPYCIFTSKNRESIKICQIPASHNSYPSNDCSSLAR